MADSDAEPRDVAGDGGRDGALWRYLMYPLRAGLQLAGGGVVLLGALGAVARQLALRDDVLLLCWTCGAVVMLAAATKRGYPLPPIGAREALVRMAVTAWIGGTVVALATFVALRLGVDIRSRMGSVVLVVVGLVIAAVGRYPRITVEGPLATAAELAHADDAIAIATGGLFAGVTLAWSDATRPVVALIAALGGCAITTRIALLGLAATLPVLSFASFAFGRRGRSPIDRASIAIALPIIAGVLLAFSDPLRSAAEAPTLSDTASALARSWRGAAAVEALGLGLGSVLALIMAMGSALRARHHGVAHDATDRRHLALLGGMCLTAALLPLMSAWRELGDALEGACLAGAVVAVAALVAVHMASAAVGGPMSKLQSRASGYAASAGFSGVLACLLWASAMTISLGGRAGVTQSAALWWPLMIDGVRQEQRFVFLGTAVFALPVALSTALVLRDRWRAALSAASRHFGWGLMWISGAVLVIALTAPPMRDAVAHVWRDNAPAGFVLADLRNGGDGCVDLEGKSIVFVDAARVLQGGRVVAAATRLDSEAGCATVAGALETPRKQLVLAVAGAVPHARLQCLVAAVAQGGGVRAPSCQLRLVAGAGDAPRCIDVDLSGGGCPASADGRFISLAAGHFEIDDALTRRLSRHDWPAEMRSVGPWMLDEGVGVSPRGDVVAADVLALLFALSDAADPTSAGERRKVVHLALTLEPMEGSNREGLPGIASAEAFLRAHDEALAAELGDNIRSRANALARCHGADRDATAEAEYRVRIEPDGRLTAVWRGGRNVPAWEVAKCTAQVLADVVVSPRAHTALVGVELTLRTQVPHVEIEQGESPKEVLAASHWSRELSEGALDACYHEAVRRHPTLSGWLRAKLQPARDGEVRTGWTRGEQVEVKVDVSGLGEVDEEATAELGRCVGELLGRTGWPAELTADEDAILVLRLQQPTPEAR